MCYLAYIRTDTINYGNNQSVGELEKEMRKPMNNTMNTGKRMKIGKTLISLK